MFTLKQRGFSMVELLIVIAGIAGVSLVVMQLGENSSRIQGDTVSTVDYTQLHNELTYMLANPKNCKASLANTTFNGATIKANPVTGLEFWTADQDGNRSRKRFYEKHKYGKLGIDRISLTMPDYTATTNWPEGNKQVFYGEIRIAGQKINSGTMKPFKEIVQPIKVIFDTNASGLSTIKECSLPNGGGGGGGGVLLQGNFDLGTAVSHTESIDTTESGVLVFTGWVHQVSLPGIPAVNAGVRGTLKVNGTTCSADYSFEGETSSVTFDASPICILKLAPGTHTIELIGSYQVVSSRSSSMSWVVFRE